MPYTIDDLRRNVNDIVNKKKEDCKNGIIPNRADIFGQNVRNIISQVINSAHQEKVRVHRQIVDDINNGQNDPFDGLYDIDESILKLEDERECFISNTENLRIINQQENYELHEMFFTESKKKKKNVTQQDTYLKEAGAKLSKDFISKKNKSNIICWIVTVVCVIFDFIVMQSAFLVGNTNDVIMTNVICGITAIALDVLPYIIGALLAKIDDTGKLLEMKNNAGKMLKADRRERWKYFITFAIVFILMLVVFAWYVFARCMIFIGGQNFSAGWETILNIYFGSNEQSLKELLDIIDWSNLSFADWIGMITPLATSSMCFIITMLHTVKSADSINGFANGMRIKIREKISDNENKTTDCERKIEEMLREKRNLKIRKWAEYVGNVPIPDDDNVFYSRLQRAALVKMMERYRGEYETFCSEARYFINATIDDIRQTFSPYCAEPKEILCMPLIEKETDVLNDIWNIDDDNKQGTITNNNIKEIAELIEKRIRIWTKNNDNPPDDSGGGSLSWDFDDDDDYD